MPVLPRLLVLLLWLPQGESSSPRAPYLSALLHLQPSLRHRFFFPGHGSLFIPPAFDPCPSLKEVFQHDLPELDGLDSVHAPEGPLKEALSLAAEYYEAHKTWFLVNGSSGGIMAAILSCFHLYLMQGGTKQAYFVIGRDSHKSVVDAIALAGCDALAISCHIEESFGLPLGMNFSPLQSVLESHQGKV